MRISTRPTKSPFSCGLATPLPAMRTSAPLDEPAGTLKVISLPSMSFRAVHGLADGDGQRHDDVTSAQGEFRVFGDGDMQVQIAVFSAVTTRLALAWNTDFLPVTHARWNMRLELFSVGRQ